MRLSEYLAVLKRTGIPIYHYNTKSLPNMPYMTYTEYAENYTKADNSIDDTIINIQLDLFTDKADKTTKKAIKKALNDNNAVFTYKVITENDEKNSDLTYLHHIFDCEVYE